MARKPFRSHYVPLPENEELDFVGTLADRFTAHPKRHRNDYCPPKILTNQHGYRQKAGGGSSVGIATDEELNRVIAVMYFLTWTRKVLKNYSNDIRKLYEIPLSEKCFGRPGNAEDQTIDDGSFDDSRAMTKAVATKLETGLRVPVNNSDLPKLQKRLAALTKGGNSEITTDAGVIRLTVTPMEVACLFRLRTLIKMSGSWLKKTVETEQWMEKQRKVIAQHASVIAPALEHAVLAFNAVCVLGEVYGLAPIDRSGVKNDFAKYLVVYERQKMDVYDKALIPTNETLHWVPDLTAKLNYHRTLMHIIGGATLTIFQIMLKSLPPELLETTSRAIRSVAARLPPSFTLAPTLQLSPFANKILAEPPPNSVRLSFGDCDFGSNSHASRTDRSRPLSVSAKKSKDRNVETITRTQGTKDERTEGSRRNSTTKEGSGGKTPSSNRNKAAGNSGDKKGSVVIEGSGGEGTPRSSDAKRKSPTGMTTDETVADKTQSFDDVRSPIAHTAQQKEEKSPPTARDAFQ